jgi:hypothetical protein
MQIPSALSIAPRNLPRVGQALPSRYADMSCAALVVETAGYLVPQADFIGRVHSVFAQACNIAVGDMLLTVCVPRAGNGATTLCLADRTVRDLRDLFDAGERVVCRDGVARTGRALLHWTGAIVWRPDEPSPMLAPARIDEHLRAAGLHLARQRRTRSSVRGMSLSA